MKLFANIQEVWDYCEECPICHGKRTVSLIVDADCSTLVRHDKKDDILIIHLICDSTKRLSSITFNCKTNTILAQDIYHIPEDQVRPIFNEKNRDEIFVDTMKPVDLTEDKLFISIHGKCDYCDKSFVSSDCIIANLENNKINFDNSIQREEYYLSYLEDGFHVSFLHYNDSVVVSRYKKNELGVFNTAGNIFYGKMIECDLTNQQKVINKLKTLIIFS